MKKTWTILLITISIYFISLFFIGCNWIDGLLSGVITQSTTNKVKSFNYNNVAIDSSTFIISHKGDSMRLLELSYKERVLFVRYSNYGCDDCINYVIGEINNQGLNSKVCLLIADVPIKDLHVIKSVEHLNGVYRLDSIITDFDYGLTPYVF